MPIAHLGSSEPSTGLGRAGAGPQRPRVVQESEREGRAGELGAAGRTEGPSRHGHGREGVLARGESAHGGPPTCRVGFLRDHHHPAFLGDGTDARRPVPRSPH